MRVGVTRFTDCSVIVRTSESWDKSSCLETANLAEFRSPVRKTQIMNPDDPVCLCFHVSKRKVLSFIRVEKPVRASQLSECQGAGTGCGWCRAWLTRLLEESREGTEADPGMAPDASEYAAGRANYIRETGRQPPPGATPAENTSDPRTD